MRSASPLFAVRKITGVAASAGICRIWRHSSRPSFPGTIMSRINSVGLCRSESAMRVFPVGNIFTANPSASRWWRTRREMSGSSSTTNMLGFMGSIVAGVWLESLVCRGDWLILAEFAVETLLATSCSRRYRRSELRLYGIRGLCGYRNAPKTDTVMVGINFSRSTDFPTYPARNVCSWI
jgi:hypothetical protein